MVADYENFLLKLFWSFFFVLAGVPTQILNGTKNCKKFQLRNKSKMETNLTLGRTIFFNFGSGENLTPF